MPGFKRLDAVIGTVIGLASITIGILMLTGVIGLELILASQALVFIIPIALIIVGLVIITFPFWYFNTSSNDNLPKDNDNNTLVLYVSLPGSTEQTMMIVDSNTIIQELKEQIKLENATLFPDKDIIVTSTKNSKKCKDTEKVVDLVDNTKNDVDFTIAIT